MHVLVPSCDFPSKSKMHVATAQALEHQPKKPFAKQCHRFVFYTDGSAKNSLASWSSILLVQSPDGEDQVVGWYGGKVGDPFSIFSDPRGTNNEGELEALLWTLLVIVKLHEVYPCASFTILSDSLLGVLQSEGEAHAGGHVQQVAGTLSTLFNVCKQVCHVDIAHVYGHSHNAWNELADITAKEILGGELSAVFPFSEGASLLEKCPP